MGVFKKNEKLPKALRLKDGGFRPGARNIKRSEDGGTGRRARFRFWWDFPWGFDSPSSHGFALHVLAAMSGGVDSTTAAALLLKAGHRVTGVTMRLWDGTGVSAPRRCRSREDMEAAARLAGFLGIPHVIVDFREKFIESIVMPFCSAYLRGETPNPCVVCNEVIKSELLLAFARRKGADAVATGHYARIEQGEDGARLLRGLDSSKDQSYFLHRISPENLSRIMFPLGAFKKDETREMARELGLSVASKAESQEVCFISGEGYGEAVERFGDQKPVRGSVVCGGRKLFDHQGIHRFTVGQRCGSPRGSGERLYVKSIDPETGEVEAAERKDVFFKAMKVRDIVWHEAPPEPSLEADVKIRYKHLPVRAEISAAGQRGAAVSFTEPQFAVTPGQAAVFYRGDMILGGGWIEKGINDIKT